MVQKLFSPYFFYTNILFFDLFTFQKMYLGQLSDVGLHLVFVCLLFFHKFSKIKKNITSENLFKLWFGKNTRVKRRLRGSASKRYTSLGPPFLHPALVKIHTPPLLSACATLVLQCL